jgi:transcription termination factor Rho
MSVIQGIVKRVNKQQFVVGTADHSYRATSKDVFIPMNLVHRFGLVHGAGITGSMQSFKGRSHLVEPEYIGGLTPESFQKRSRFSDLVALDPTERFNLGAQGDRSMRIVDLIAPIGRGTRQLIVSPPKAGKTILLEQIVQAIHHDSRASRIIVLLVDERPEEVTQFRRAVEGIEVVASTSDHGADEHVHLAELILAHIQIELECGRDTVLVVDSLTRISRAFNNRSRKGSQRQGHTMSGGLEAGALEIPRRLFGLARKIEGGGAVTVIATCLIDTGSRMDQLIFEEFKGTGNSEIFLDRSLAEARIFPAIDIPASGTRKEAKLYNDRESRGLVTLRRVLSNYGHKEAVQALFKLLDQYPTNESFLQSMCMQG